MAFSFRELKWLPHSPATHTHCLAKLANIYTKWRYVTEKRIGSWPEWIVTNQRTVNSHCGNTMAAFMCEGILTQEKKWQNLCIPVQITPVNQNYCSRYVSKIWSVYDSTDMLYMPEFQGWQLSNWCAKSVSWRVNSTPRHKQTRFTSVKALKHE